MQLIQTHLTQRTATGTDHLIAWLPIRRDVRPGSVISLDRDDTNRWLVAAQYSTVDQQDIQRGWGLALPPSQRTER